MASSNKRILAVLGLTKGRALSVPAMLNLKSPKEVDTLLTAVELELLLTLPAWLVLNSEWILLPQSLR